MDYIINIFMLLGYNYFIYFGSFFTNQNIYFVSFFTNQNYFLVRNVCLVKVSEFVCECESTVCLSPPSCLHSDPPGGFEYVGYVLQLH